MTLVVQSGMSQQLLNCHYILVQTFMFPKGWVVITKEIALSATCEPNDFYISLSCALCLVLIISFQSRLQSIACNVNLQVVKTKRLT